MPPGRLRRRLAAGDTDFSLTAEVDRWDGDGVRFVFGYDAKANLVVLELSADGAEFTVDDIEHLETAVDVVLVLEEMEG